MSSVHYPENVPQHKTVAPFSPLAIVRGSEFIVLSGQGSMSLEGTVVGDTVAAQTEVIFNNVVNKLESVGGSLDDVFRVMVYLADLADWQEFNAIYAGLMPQPYPTRTCVGVQLLAGMKVEIDFWAVAR